MHSSSASPLKIASGATVASVDAAHVLSKRVHGSKHFLRTPAGIAFDTSVIMAAQRAGAERIEVTDLDDNNKLYWVSMAEFRRGAFALDRGYGPQLCMGLAKWHTGAPVAQLTMDLWGRG